MKKIPNFKKYSITKDGKVYSHYYNKFLSPGVCRRGYNRVSLTNDYGTFSKGVHSLILETYVGKRPIGFHGAHLDGNPSNNILSNLKWCSPKENMYHRNIHGTAQVGEKHHSAKAKKEQVIWLRKNLIEFENGKTNIYELSKKTGLHFSTVTNIVRGNSWKHLPNIKKNKKKRLNIKKAEEIRSMFLNEKTTVCDLARKLKLSHSCISNIINGKTWKHI